MRIPRQAILAHTPIHGRVHESQLAAYRAASVIVGVHELLARRLHLHLHRHAHPGTLTHRHRAANDGRRVVRVDGRPARRRRLVAFRHGTAVAISMMPVLVPVPVGVHVPIHGLFRSVPVLGLVYVRMRPTALAMMRVRVCMILGRVTMLMMPVPPVVAAVALVLVVQIQRKSRLVLGREFRRRRRRRRANGWRVIRRLDQPIVWRSA